MICYDASMHNTITVEPVYNGHCINRSPLYNSQMAKIKWSLEHVHILTCYLSLLVVSMVTTIDRFHLTLGS